MGSLFSAVFYHLIVLKPSVITEVVAISVVAFAENASNSYEFTSHKIMIENYSAFDCIVPPKMVPVRTFWTDFLRICFFLPILE